MLNYLSPALKVLMSLVFVMIVAVAQWKITLIICAAAVIMAVLMARVSISKILKAFKPMWVFITVLAAVTAITSGLAPATVLTARLIIITTAISVLSATTENKLERGLRTLLKPLSFFRVPVRDIAFVIALTLRFIPHITEEWDKLRISREARGVIINDLPVKSRIKITFQTIGTLLQNTAKTAEATAMAMDSRGYGSGEFTPREKDTLKRVDIITLILFTIFCIFLVLLEFLH